jgi:hypothetical protein
VNCIDNLGKWRAGFNVFVKNPSGSGRKKRERGDNRRENNFKKQAYISVSRNNLEVLMNVY